MYVVLKFKKVQEHTNSETQIQPTYVPNTFWQGAVYEWDTQIYIILMYSLCK